MQDDDEATFAELDGLLDEAPTVSDDPSADETEVRLYVAVDAQTLDDLEQRATTQGTDLNAAAAEAPRAGARGA